MYVKEAAAKSGVSVRTLHHYDEIGLLTPETEEQGYRVYTEEDLAKLQQILFFRELGFKLSRIKEILEDPEFDRLEELELQRKALIVKKERLERLIATIDTTIKKERTGESMSNKERFEGFDFSNNPYEEEAIRRWGKEAVERTKQNTVNLPPEKRKGLEHDLTELFRKLASLMGDGTASESVQEGIGEWYRYLNEIGSYSLEAFKGLGAIYVEDERFRNNMEQYGDGFANFMCEAITVYADKRLK